MQAVCWLLCLSTAGTFAVLQKDQVAQQAIKLYRSKGATQAGQQRWLASNCKWLVGLLHQKNVVVKKLAAAANAVGQDMGLSEAERHFQVSDCEDIQDGAKIFYLDYLFGFISCHYGAVQSA